MRTLKTALIGFVLVLAIGFTVISCGGGSPMPTNSGGVPTPPPTFPMAMGIVYVGNRSGNSINVVDVEKGTITTTIPNVPTPQLMVFTPNGGSLFVTTYASGGPVYVISTATNSVLDTVTVGFSNHGIAVTPDGSQVYVANFDSGTISIISTATNTVTSTITIGAGASPTDIAITPDGTYQYVTDAKHDVVYVLKGSAGVIASIPVGSFPVGIAASPDGKTVYAANYNDGTLSVIRRSDNALVNTIAVGPADWAVAFTPDGSKAYVTSETSNNMSVIDSASQHATSIAVGVGTTGLAVTRDGRYVFATSKSGVLKEIYTATDAVSTAASGLGEAVPVAVPPSQ
jgi:YVTN family beta-propeller protein